MHIHNSFMWFIFNLQRSTVLYTRYNHLVFGSLLTEPLPEVVTLDARMWIPIYSSPMLQVNCLCLILHDVGLTSPLANFDPPPHQVKIPCTVICDTWTSQGERWLDGSASDCKSVVSVHSKLCQSLGGLLPRMAQSCVLASEGWQRST
jgi:hypothetical protein